MRRITITAYGSFGFNEYLGLEAQYILRGTPFVSATFAAGDTKSFDLTEGQWDRIAPTLEQLSLKSVAVTNPTTGLLTGAYRPLLIYSCEPLPSSRARITGVIPGNPSRTNAAISVTINGENLMHGVKATGTMGLSTAALIFQARRQGPEANDITVEVYTPRGAGSVTVTMSPSVDKFAVKIDVVPAAAGPTAAAIAAQITANYLANFFVYTTTSGGGGGNVVPAAVTLTGGEGASIAYTHFLNSTAGEYLTVVARKPGNGGRLINVSIATPAGGGSVTVSGTAIAVVPAAGASDPISVRNQINAAPTAAALVIATGAGTHALGVKTATWLHGGTGEDVLVKVGPTTVAVLTHTDTQITGTLDGTTLAATYAATDEVVLNVFTGFERLQASLQVSA
jgi:hypothetical protein